MKKKAFTLVELLIAIFILQLSLMAFFTVNQSTSSRGMEAYYKFMAYSLGKEVIDFSQGMGYRWAKAHLDSKESKPFPLSDCSSGPWHKVTDHLIFSKNLNDEDVDVNDAYFSECKSFERRIEFKEIKADQPDGKSVNGILITAQLRIQKGSRAAKYLKNEVMNFSTTVLELIP